MTRATSAYIRRFALLVAASAWIAPAHAFALRMVYAPSATGDAVYTLPVATDWSLSSLGSFSLSSQPQAVTSSPDGQHIYVSRAGSAAVNVYSVQYDGSLQYQSSAGTGSTPTALAMTPSGGNLFSADAGGGVSGFAVSANGSLSSPAGSGIQLAAGAPDGLAVSPDGGRLFVADGAQDKLKVFSIGPGAALSFEHDADSGSGPEGIAVSPDGAHIYVANATSGTVSGFSVSPQGDLAAISGSPFTAAAGARGLALTADGSRLLVASDEGGNVASYAVGNAGGLTAAGTPNSLAGASAVAVSANGRHAFAAGNALIRAYDVSQSGALTQRGSDVATSGQHRGLVLSPDQAPNADFESVAAYPGSPTKFEGGHSWDPDGSIATWAWNFGDGTTATGSHLDHTYAQAGEYQVTLTVTDDQGCSADLRFTGQVLLCAGSATAKRTQTVTITDPTPPAPPDPPCIHDGNDGFCGTPDLKAPMVSVVSITDGSSITTVDAPDEIAGFITPDPSGIKSVLLRLTKAAGFKTVKKKVKKNTCKRSKTKHKKNKCKSAKKKKTSTNTRVRAAVTGKVALCDTLAAGKNYLVRKACSQVTYLSITGDATFRYPLPVVLGLGSYTLDVLAVDDAGNSDFLEAGRNHLTFKIVKTPSNSGGSGGSTTPTTTTPSTPIDDTGSPFG